MFDFINGEIAKIGKDFMVIENNGIGYKVFTSSNTMTKLQLGTNITIHTQMHVRDDGIFLYGFSKEDEMDMFNDLLLVSKVGPKVALSILSTLSPNKLRLAILSNNIAELCKSPGVGKKTAERIVVELKDRIEQVDIEDLEEDEIADLNSTNNTYEEVVQALTSLGYGQYETEKVLSRMDIEDMSIEEIIRNSLKRLSK